MTEPGTQALTPGRQHTGSVRDRLLAAADELFYAEGITAVGVERIRRAADVAKSSIYEHFGSKDGLVAAYLAGRSAGWRERLGAALAAADPVPAAQLDVVFDELGAWFTEPDFRGCPFINASAELPDPSHPAAVVAAEHRAWVLGLLTDIAVRAGARNPTRLGRQLALLYDASMVAAHNGGSDAAADAKAAAATLLRAAAAS
ncbi:TetR/AcrR family transcriptional regulator [Pseudonocardia sp. DLS-67]